MAVMSYKCPNCGGGLTFDPKKQKLVCEYCLSEFTEEEMKRLEEEEAKKREESEGAGVDAGAESGVGSGAGAAGNILLLLPQPGGTFRSGIRRIPAGLCPAVCN